ncbi:MAG: hypothetical protein LBR16_04690 [Treponema sp.]|jgi:uncharacterized membrane protein|nr:hypothetical protein [Treponema sp.]
MKKRITTEQVIKVIIGGVLILYPVFIFVNFKVGMDRKYTSIGVMIFASLYILISGRNYRGRHRWMMYLCPLILLGIGALCFLSQTGRMRDTYPWLSEAVLRTYPALSDLVYTIIFLLSLFIPPPIVYTFAATVDKNFAASLPEAALRAFCRRMTIIWIAFFPLDGVAAVVTTMLCINKTGELKKWYDMLWGIYNAAVSYLLMGFIFVGEYAHYRLLVHRYKKSRPQAAPNKELSV